MKENLTLEELYQKLLQEGKKINEIEAEITNILTLRYLDTLSPSEAHLILGHQGLMRPNPFEHMDDYDEDDELEEFLGAIGVKGYRPQNKKVEAPQTSIDLGELAKEVEQIKDQVNDWLIDKYTEPVEIIEEEDEENE